MPNNVQFCGQTVFTGQTTGKLDVNPSLKKYSLDIPFQVDTFKSNISRPYVIIVSLIGVFWITVSFFVYYNSQK